MKKVFVSLIAMLIVSISFAQSKSTNSSTYKNALGVKVWDGGGISYKHFFKGNNAGELIGYFWNRGFRITGLYEIHGNFEDAPGLKWYIGHQVDKLCEGQRQGNRQVPVGQGR
jgi:hypothetical protein